MVISFWGWEGYSQTKKFKWHYYWWNTQLNAKKADILRLWTFYLYWWMHIVGF